MSVAELARPTAAPRRTVSTRLLRSELGMVFRRRRNQMALAVLAAIPILIGIAVKLSAPAPGEGPPFLADVTQNGVFLAFTALVVVLPLFLPLAISVVAGDAVAGEAQLGTLRYLLTVPVGRTRLLAVKYAALVIFCLAATVTVALVGVLLGAVLFHTGSATLLSGTQVGLADVLGRLAMVIVYITISMTAVGAIGLLVSTLTETPVAAMAATATLVIISQVLGQVPQLSAIHPYLFTHYWLNFGDLLRDPVSFDGLQRGVLVSLVYAALFGATAWSRFTGKDVSS